MPDLLTHVLIVYSGLTVLSWYSDRVAPAFIPVAMIGAIIPDLNRISVIIDPELIESLLGTHFTFLVIHRLGGTLALVGVGALLFAGEHRRTAFGYLFVGALTQYPLDALIQRANGLTPPYLYPFSWWQAPAGNLYLSSDLWMAIPAIVLALAIWYFDRRVRNKQAIPFVQFPSVIRW